MERRKIELLTSENETQIINISLIPQHYYKIFFLST